MEQDVEEGQGILMGFEYDNDGKMELFEIENDQEWTEIVEVYEKIVESNEGDCD